MDLLTLSRIQFGLTIGFHYIFPPLSIGLGLLLVFMEGLYLKTNVGSHAAPELRFAGIDVSVTNEVVLIWVAALVYGLVIGFDIWSGILFGIITLLMLFGNVVDNLFMGAGARKTGASWLSVGVALLGGIIGSLLMPPLGGLVLAMLSLVNPGDEVIIFDPFFVMYEPLVQLVGGQAVFVDTYPDFRIDVRRVTTIKEGEVAVGNRPLVEAARAEVDAGQADQVVDDHHVLLAQQSTEPDRAAEVGHRSLPVTLWE